MPKKTGCNEQMLHFKQFLRGAVSQCVAVKFVLSSLTRRVVCFLKFAREKIRVNRWLSLCLLLRGIATIFQHFLN